MLVGYKLVDGENTLIQQWGGEFGTVPEMPNPILLPNGDRVHAPSLNQSYSGYTLKLWYEEKPITVEDVRAEARRRILARYPDWKQVNMTARGVELLRKGEANLTPAEATESAAMQAAWDWVKAVRAACDALEVSLPSSFADDLNWPV